MTEIEQIHQVGDRGRVGRHVGVIFLDDRVGQIIAAAIADGFEKPVVLDKLQDGHVIRIRMRDVARCGRAPLRARRK